MPRLLMEGPFYSHHVANNILALTLALTLKQHRRDLVSMGNLGKATREMPTLFLGSYSNSSSSHSSTRHGILLYDLLLT
jgi:hypothetical protein